MVGHALGWSSGQPGGWGSDRSAERSVVDCSISPQKLLVDEEVGKNRDRRSAKSRQRKKIDRLVGRSVGQSNRSVGKSGVFISLKQKLSKLSEENGSRRRKKE